MTDYMRSLEGEPTDGDTVALVSEKWPPIDDKDVTSEPSAPWEGHRTQGRKALRIELQQAASYAERAANWAEALTDLPDGLLTDVRRIAEKLRQTVQTLS